MYSLCGRRGREGILSFSILSAFQIHYQLSDRVGNKNLYSLLCLPFKFVHINLSSKLYIINFNSYNSYSVVGQRQEWRRILFFPHFVCLSDSLSDGVEKRYVYSPFCLPFEMAHLNISFKLKLYIFTFKQLEFKFSF